MKKEHDFSKEVSGKFYNPDGEFSLPIYLEPDIVEFVDNLSLEKNIAEEQYRELQKLGEFDLKTSSWVKAHVEIGNLGGAILCDRRFGHVFTYHNGAESYYAARGFRGSLRV